MSQRTVQRWAVAWPGAAALVTAAGYVRWVVMGGSRGVVAATVEGAAAVVALTVYVWVLHRWWPTRSRVEALAIGVAWAAAMVAFDAVVGVAAGRSVVDALWRDGSAVDGTGLVAPFALLILPPVTRLLQRTSRLPKLVEIVDGGAQIALTMIGAPLLRLAYNRWGTTVDERRGSLPGDDYVPVPRLHSTRAITVDAPPPVVWSWLVQIGQDRGGTYSFDAVENLLGADVHSVQRLRPDLQWLDGGELVRLGAKGFPCYRVAIVDPPRTLVLVGADPTTTEVPPAPFDGEAKPAATWQWQLRPVDGGRRTRLLVRQRVTFPTAQSRRWHLMEPVVFVMERRMLTTLKALAEGSTAAATPATAA